VIDAFKCNGCGTCVKRCPPKIIGLIKEKAAILVQLCEECGICAEVCPIGAIHFKVPNAGIVKTHEAYAVKR
jgi:MinD superfamily P-loop ATPase